MLTARGHLIVFFSACRYQNLSETHMVPVCWALHTARVDWYGTHIWYPWYNLAHKTTSTTLQLANVLIVIAMRITRNTHAHTHTLTHFVDLRSDLRYMYQSSLKCSSWEFFSSPLSPLLG